ncbi:AarF/UbiB family protein [uncultured Endozoicomonas sp.]|uniref:AarF/UbiB family protein n=1 Tax=uncultured Endozoicomonas sp. TaxID=432652 RepID=UPI002610BB33|nr:AarF/UbiB family protein [uncultured Endozoicomonas sp.]
MANVTLPANQACSSAAKNQHNPPNTHQKRQENKAMGGRTVSVHQDNPGFIKKGCNSICNTVQSVVNWISITCRAIYKTACVACYFVKHAVFGAEFTHEHFKSYVHNLGPTYAKLLQTIGMEENLAESITKKLGATEAERKKCYGVLKDFLDNNPPMPLAQAQSILAKEGCKDYKVKNHLATGTLGSCFEVEKDGKRFVAKIVPEEKAIQVEAGRKSLGMLMMFNSAIANTVKEFTDPFVAECDLSQEKSYHQRFASALAKTDTHVTLPNGLGGLPQPMTLSFKIPEVIETGHSKRVLMMQNVDGGHTLNQLTNLDNSKLRAEAYQKCLGVVPFSDQLTQFWLKELHQKGKDKWTELKTCGLVHGDFHPGNIMLSFRQGGEIDLWILDFGNSLALSEKQRSQFTKVVQLMSQQIDPFSKAKINERDMSELVDVIWSQMAISHKDKSEKAKNEFNALLKEQLNTLNDPMEVLKKAARTSEDQEKLRKMESDIKGHMDNPWVKNMFRMSIQNAFGTVLSSVCKNMGVEIDPAFTHFVFSHTRAGMSLVPAK